MVMARGLGFVGFGLLSLLLLGDFWYAGAAPAKFDVKEHIATSTRCDWDSVPGMLLEPAKLYAIGIELTIAVLVMLHFCEISQVLLSDRVYIAMCSCCCFVESFSGDQEKERT